MYTYTNLKISVARYATLGSDYAILESIESVYIDRLKVQDRFKQDQADKFIKKFTLELVVEGKMLDLKQCSYLTF